MACQYPSHISPIILDYLFYNIYASATKQKIQT
jgi:hypothetical protein